MNTLSEQERLVAVETKLDIVIEQQKATNQTLSGLIPTLVTQTQLADKLAAVQQRIVELEVDLSRAKQRSVFQTWLTGTLSAAFGAVMVILIQSYLSK